MQTPKKLDLQHIFTWLLADGIIDQAHVKAGYNQALLCNTIGAMHPLTAVAQCKILPALPPHRRGRWTGSQNGWPCFSIQTAAGMPSRQDACEYAYEHQRNVCRQK